MRPSLKGTGLMTCNMVRALKHGVYQAKHAPRTLGTFSKVKSRAEVLSNGKMAASMKVTLWTANSKASASTTSQI